MIKKKQGKKQIEKIKKNDDEELRLLRFGNRKDLQIRNYQMTRTVKQFLIQSQFE